MAFNGQRQPDGFEDQLRRMILVDNGSPSSPPNSRQYNQPTVRLPPAVSYGTAPYVQSQQQQHGFPPVQSPTYHGPGPRQRDRYQQSMQIDPNAFHRGGFDRPFAGGNRGRGRGAHQLFNPNQPQRPQFVSPMERHGRQAQYLEHVAAVEISKVEMSPEEREEKETFRVALEKLCHEVYAANPERIPKISLEPFGSFQSGFATAGSDMDLVIVVRDNDSNSACFSLLEDDLPRALEKKLLQVGYGT